ncbi:MAG TPA: nitrate reductase molybdenum cofactor assembly chaperone, partial [Rubrivivax sp.]|nr:nitrate reductase molybdenum cofactor assembly chaperone [Rubrivivax sp.]
ALPATGVCRAPSAVCAAAPPAQAREFLGETAHLVRAIFSALLARRSPYASVLAAVLDLAGEKAEPVALPDEPDLDEAWAEPEAFAGCSTAGQQRPDAARPVHVTRHKSSVPTEGVQA